MRLPAEANPTTEAEDGAAYVGFGLSLDIDHAIDVSGMGFAEEELNLSRSSSTALPRTSVRLGADAIERRWGAAGGGARRVRELKRGKDVALSVDYAEQAGYLMQAEGFGRLLVSPSGDEILCDPDLEAGPDWAFILSAQALPLAATLHGRELLHAAGIGVRGGAVLFAGEPGGGKSSLAAAFVRRGATLFGDDAISLEVRGGEILTHPSVGAIHLRAAEHDRLTRHEREELGDFDRISGKLRYAHHVPHEPLPFSALFLLERSAEGSPIVPAEDVDPFTLLASTFNLSVRTPERLTRQLDLVAALAASERVFRLRVLPDSDATSLAALVDRHLESSVA